MHASSTLPARLPIQVQIQLDARSPTDARLVNTPRVRTRLLPVTNSEPAKITIVRAPPKQTPITTRSVPGAAFAISPPIVKIRTIAAPTYIPARADRTRCP